MSAPQRTRSIDLLQAAALVAGLAALVFLAEVARTGLLTRYWADDYCYSLFVQGQGLLRGALSWYLNAGNRFSTILLVGVQELFGMRAIELVTAAVLLAWVGAWAFFLAQTARLAGTGLSWRFSLPLALVEVAFAALLAPDRLQTIYWRMGTLHYTFPLALLLAQLGLIARFLRGSGGEEAPIPPAPLPGGKGGKKGLEVKQAAEPPASPPNLFSMGRGAAFFLLALFAGGFSETYAALQAGVYLLGIAGALVLLRGARRKGALQALISALLGGLGAMLLMLLSPSNGWRQAALPPPSSLGELLAYTLRYTYDFTRDTLRGMPLPLLVLALSAGLLGYAGFWRRRAQTLPARAALLAALASLLAGVLLCAAAIAPSVYAGLQFPAPRALMPARFAYLLSLSCAAFFLSALFPWVEGIGATEWRQYPHKKIVSPLPVEQGGMALLPFARTALLAALILAAGLYPLRSLPALEAQRQQLATWAQRWDARTAGILAERDGGHQVLIVRQVEVVSGLEDLGPDAGNWVNACAAGYFKVQSISARPTP